MKVRYFPIPLIFVCAFTSLSCSKEKIRTYRVADEDSTPAATSTAAPAPAAPTGTGSLRWDVPKEWKAGTPGQFQTALYLLDGDAKVSVSNLPGDAGGEAANVNRWRRRLANAGAVRTRQPRIRWTGL